MKNFLVVVFLFITTLTIAQERNTWQIGVGTALTRFSDKDASFIGDKHLFQIPILNLTVPVSEKISLDAAVSFNTIDNFIGVQNSVKYFSLDGSVRYNFDTNGVLSPYIFMGASLVDSELKTTPTLNGGGGLTFWFNEKIGLNSQIYYKHSFNEFESMRSHIQGTLSLIFSFDSLFGKGGSIDNCY